MKSLTRPRPQIAIVGYGRHGKDEAALTLHGKGPFKVFGSTSWAALPEMAEALNVPAQIAWENRHLNREFWKSHCDYLRRNDPCYLIRKVLAGGNIVSGIRDRVELEAALSEGLFDAVLWIDRPGFPADPTVTFDKSLATDVIVNDGTLEHFRETVLSWAALKGFI